MGATSTPHGGQKKKTIKIQSRAYLIAAASYVPRSFLTEPPPLATREGAAVLHSPLHPLSVLQEAGPPTTGSVAVALCVPILLAVAALHLRALQIQVALLVTDVTSQNGAFGYCVSDLVAVATHRNCGRSDEWAHVYPVVRPHDHLLLLSTDAAYPAMQPFGRRHRA